jgi:hypothetical protein
MSEMKPFRTNEAPGVIWQRLGDRINEGKNLHDAFLVWIGGHSAGMVDTTIEECTQDATKLQHAIDAATEVKGKLHNMERAPEDGLKALADLNDIMSHVREHSGIPDRKRSSDDPGEIVHLKERLK